MTLDITSTFSSKQEAIASIMEKNIAEKKPHKVLRSCQDRYTVGCSEKECLFRVNVRRRKDGLFHVSSFHEHTCSKLFPKVKTSWVKEKAKEAISNDKIVGPNSLQNTMRVDYGVNIKKWTSQRALRKARSSLSNDEDGFGKLAQLFDALRESDGNTTTDIVTKDGLFFRAFLCPGSCANAFAFTLRIVGMDACHLKTKHGGVLLVMTAIDGNSNIFPVCLGIAEGENKDSWSWFLRNVRASLGIGGGAGVVIMSDMEKGLDGAVSEVLPHAHHGYCLFHMEKNFVKKFHSNMDSFFVSGLKMYDEERV